VFGGTVNCGDGALTVRATAAAADSTVARMARLVEEVRPVLALCQFRVASCLTLKFTHFLSGRIFDPSSTLNPKSTIALLVKVLLANGPTPNT
jgi:cation transport ATPase